jgi:hypothetical protein
MPPTLTEPERGKDLCQHRAAHHVPDQRDVNEHPYYEQRKGRSKSENLETSPDTQHHEQRYVHAEHDELAVGEIDEIHHPPDEG